MIKVLKLQKAVIAFILGIIALVAYKIMSLNGIDASFYVLELSGLFFVTGAVLFLYPIFFSKADKEGNVELDPEKQEEESTEVK